MDIEFNSHGTSQFTQDFPFSKYVSSLHCSTHRSAYRAIFQYKDHLSMVWYNGNPYCGKMASLYWGGPPVRPKKYAHNYLSSIATTQIAKFMGSTWGPPGSYRPQMGPMLAPWTLLSGKDKQRTSYDHKPHRGNYAIWSGDLKVIHYHMK